MPPRRSLKDAIQWAINNNKIDQDLIFVRIYTDKFKTTEEPVTRTMVNNFLKFLMPLKKEHA